MKIKGITNYEFLLSIRSMRFKIVTIFYVVIIGLLSLGIALLNKIGESPMIASLSGFSPYISSFLFSFISAFTIPFVISDFIGTDKRVRVNEVIYSKSISNLEYILGKFIGSVFVITLICIIVLFVSSILQISFAVREYKLYPYITSFFLICFPTIIFISGLVYVLTSIIKNRFIVFLITIAISILSIFIVGDKWFRLFDFPAITLPLNSSDIMGYGNITNEILQRIAYVLFGLSLVTLSSIFPFRLPEKSSLNLKILIISFATIIVSILFFTIIINNILRDKQIRKNTLLAHNKYSEFPIVEVKNYDMNVTLFPSKHRLKANIKMDILYPIEKNLNKLIFVLNAGLKITDITDENGHHLPYIREYSIIDIDTEKNDRLPEQIIISYEGKINQNSFYLLEERKEKIFLEFAGIKMPQIRWNVGECTSWIGEGNVFLIPESRWYPVPGVDYKDNVKILKPTNFSTAKISVTIPEKYSAVTQGLLTSTKIEKNNIIYTFRTDVSVPQFSLNAGKYIVKHTEVDSIHFYAYYSPIHRRYAEFFADTSNVAQKTIKELKDWIETETKLKYPYPTLSFVEIPLDFRTYFESYDDFNPLVQPEIVMVNENNLNLSSVQYISEFNSEQTRAIRRGEAFDVSERKKFYFINYLAGNLALSGKFGSRSISNGDWGLEFLNIIPEYWGFQIGCKDRISSLIRKGITRQLLQFLGAGDEDEFGLNKKNIYDAIETKPFVEFSPKNDGTLYDNVMRLKCPGIMKSLCQDVGEDKYKEIISKFIEEHKFKNFSFEDFKIFAGKISGKDLDSFFHQWFETALLPGYTIVKAESYPIFTKKIQTQYQMKTRVRNWEECNGNIKVHFKTEKDDIYRDVYFKPYEEKEVGVVVPNKPRFVEIEPIFAKNWSKPKFTYNNLPEKPINAVPFDGEKTVEPEKSNEIIVDDKDDGFSIVSSKKEKTRLFGKNENNNNIKEEFNGLTNLLLSGLKDWTRIYHYNSYGKYRNSLVTKYKGKGNTYARWKTLIPESGSYDTYIFVNNYTNNTSFRGERIGKVFYISVLNNDEESKVEIKTSRDMDGWHYLGQFEYKKGDTPEIRLSDKCDGSVIADAVKWVSVY